MQITILFGESLQSSDLQFGFKKDSSCTQPFLLLIESVKYFMNNGSRVHCVSLDASKTFDKVLHHGLYHKLLLKGVSGLFVKLLMYRYSHLQSAVLWNSVLDECFIVLCGVRQGGVLSPYLFAFCI